MKPVLVDTHAHLNFKDYQDNLDQVIERAKKTGVTKIICVSSNVADSEKAIELARKYQGTVFAAVGIHPQQTDPENTDSLEEQIKKLRRLAQEKEVIAIGECGLDYSPAPPGEKDRPKKEQARFFGRQLEIALKLKLPVIVHSRQALHQTIEILKQHMVPKLEGVIHCYSGGKKGIEQVNEIDFYFGVDGNLTYDQGLQETFKLIPLEKILLETDCPYLAPEPFRGQSSEPAHVKIIAEFLAKLKGVQLNEVAQKTTQNAKKLFKI